MCVCVCVSVCHCELVGMCARANRLELSCESLVKRKCMLASDICFYSFIFMCFYTIYQLNSAFRQIKMSYQRVSSSIRFASAYSHFVFILLLSLCVCLSLSLLVSHSQPVYKCVLDVVVFSLFVFCRLLFYIHWLHFKCGFRSFRNCVEYLKYLHTPLTPCFAIRCRK